MFPATRNQNSVYIYLQIFNNLDIISIDFTDGLRIEDVPEKETKIKLNPNVFELSVEVADGSSVTSKTLPRYFWFKKTN